MTDFTEYCGIIGRTHGVDGTMVLVDTVGIGTTVAAGSTIGIGYSRDFARPYTVTAYESTPQRTLLHVREVDTVERATALIDQAVFLRQDDVTADPTERYTIGAIEGCTVVTDDGRRLGVIHDVWLLPANDVWEVLCDDGSTIPLPVIDDVIRSVDLTTKTITVHLLDGLQGLSVPSDSDDA